VDFIIERKRTGNIAKLTASLYEYCAGFLWGGWEYPLSRGSAVYQIVVSFIVLVIVSSYTANLAAAITVSTRPSLSISSLNDALTNHFRICGMNSEAESFTVLYPHVAISETSGSYTLSADSLEANTCDGMVTTRASYDTLRNDVKYCDLRVVAVIRPSSSGWVTSQQAPCVDNAISFALNSMQMDGTLARLRRPYFKEAYCFQGTIETAANRVPMLELRDFTGIFVLWATVTCLVVAQAYTPNTVWSKVTFWKVKVQDNVSAAPQGGDTTNEDGQAVNYDSESSMLREVLRELAALRSEVTNQQHATAFVRDEQQYTRNRSTTCK